jgi:protein-disulfide isomerase
MTPTKVLACVVALIAIAGCNSKQGSSGGSSSSPARNIHVDPPKDGDWSTIVNPTPDGGFLMGNPQAKVQLIEIGSLTCPHCREFDEKGVPPLVQNYVKTGKVGYEFRNYVRDPFDLTAALIARCNGAKSFFPLARALYSDQPTWLGNIQKLPQSQVEGLQNLPPNRQFLEIAQLAALPQWAAARGVPQAKTAQCLTDEKAVNQLVQMNTDTTTQYPDFQGTPSFVINGKFFPIANGTPVWEQLKAGLDKAGA